MYIVQYLGITLFQEQTLFKILWEFCHFLALFFILCKTPIPTPNYPSSPLLSPYFFLLSTLLLPSSSSFVSSSIFILPLTSSSLFLPFLLWFTLLLLLSSLLLAYYFLLLFLPSPSLFFINDSLSLSFIFLLIVSYATSFLLPTLSLLSSLGFFLPPPLPHNLPSSFSSLGFVPPPPPLPHNLPSSYSFSSLFPWFRPSSSTSS